MNKLSGIITHIGSVIEVGNYKKIMVHVKEDKQEYPQSCNFEVFGQDKVDNILKYNQVGDVVEVDYNLKAQESKREAGVFFNTIQSWKITKHD
jgi:hypothetical protein